MKKVLILALILTMVFGTIAASAQVRVPPGQAKKGILPAEWLQFLQMQRAQDDDNEEIEEMYGPFKLLPPGLQNKGTPPGLDKKEGLPPGLMGRDVLPPGIQMRFMETWQWRNEWGPDDKDDVEIHEAATQTALMALLDDEDVEMIILKEGFTITEPIVIENDREVWINGNNKLLIANFDFDGWMIEVTEDSHLHLWNVILNGENEDDLDGVIWVEEGSKLTANRNTLRNAEVGFGIEVDEYKEDDEKEFLDNNWFYNVEEPVVFYDEDDGDVLYPEEE